MNAQLIARDVTFLHGPTVVLAGVSLTLAPGVCAGITGPNGIGKSTLLKLLAGELTPAEGRVERVPSTATVALLDQELRALPGESVGDLLARRCGVRLAETELDAATQALAQGEPGSDQRYDDALGLYLRSGAADFEHRRGDVLRDVGLDEGRADQVVDTLSGGQRGRVGLAAVLLSQADVLLLDEPTNDLDLVGLDLLERFVLGRREPTAVVSHDRAFLSRVVTAVVELDEFSRTATVYDGSWDAFLHERDVARRLAEDRYATYTDRVSTLKSRAQRERQWASSGVNKEKKQPRDNDKAQRQFRVDRTEQLASRARRTEAAMERLETVDKPWEGWELRLSIAGAERSGDRVADLVGAVVRRGSFTLGPVDLSIRYGERVAITGPNGHGKTTLLGALLGELDLDHGTQHLGRSVVVGRMDQARTRFGSEESLLDRFCDETGLILSEARSTLAKLGLGAEHVMRPAAKLSPGERTRAVLAAFAAIGVNLMVLDEPTNHLDLVAIEQVEAALDTFDGTVLLVTHDRAFLEAIRLSRRVAVEHGRIVSDETL